MTSAMWPTEHLNSVPKQVRTPLQPASFDLPKCIQWASALTASTVKTVAKLSTAIYDPIRQSAIWEEHDGLVSDLESCWVNTEAIESVSPMSEEISEEAVLDALLTLDLTLRLSPVREFTATAHVVHSEKWSPRVTDPQGLVNFES